MQVRHYMPAAAAVTHPDEPVVAAARLMRQRSIGALPVCEDDGTLAGMLTDRDIVVRCVSAGDDPQTATVRGIMSRDPVTIEADADAHRDDRHARRAGAQAARDRGRQARGCPLDRRHRPLRQVGHGVRAGAVRHHSECLQAVKRRTPAFSSGRRL